MGWTYFPHRGESTLEIIGNEIDGVIESEQAGGAVYSVCEQKLNPGDAHPIYQTEADGVYRFILVTLIDRSYSQIGLKHMEEGMGPNASCCPIRLIDMASRLRADGSPHGVRWAHEWRERCTRNALTQAGAR